MAGRDDPPELEAPLLPTAADDEEEGLSASESRLTIDPAAEQEAQRAAEERAARRREMKGLGLNALSTLFGTGMSLFAKVSGSQGIGVFEIVLTRSLILVVATAPELLYYRVNPFADKRRRWLLVLRGVLGFCSVSTLYMAVGLLPLADASVLSFLSPLFVAALSPFILKEKSNRATLMGIPVALVGVVLVAKPAFLFGGGDSISGLGVAVGVAQALFNSLSRMTVRALSLNSSERMSSIIFGQGAISCLGAAIACGATRRFVLPTAPPVWGALLAGGFLGYLYQLALTGGLQRARAAPAVAMSYLSVIWAIIADVVVFKDLPDPLSLLGAGVICLSSGFVAFSQKKKASHKAADTRFDASTMRLAQETPSAARLAWEGAAGEPAGPLLLGRGGSGVDEDGAGGSSPGGGSDWASAREVASHASSGVGWWDAASLEGSSPPDGGGGGLKASVKEAAAAAAAAALEADMQPPDTPAAEAALPLQQHGSEASLPPLGASPPGGGGGSSIGGGSERG